MAARTNEGDLRSDKIRWLYRWWLDRGRGDVPDRADVDPVELKRFLPNMLIADVEINPFRVRYRLVGTRVVEATGLDFTGKYLDELIPVQPDEPRMEDYRIAFADRKAVFGLSTIVTALRARYTYEFGLFPLRKGGQSIQQFIALEDYFNYSRLAGPVVSWRLDPQLGTDGSGWPH